MGPSDKNRSRRVPISAWPYCLAAGILLLAGRYDWSAASPGPAWRGLLCSAFFFCITVPVFAGVLRRTPLPLWVQNTAVSLFAALLTLPYRWLGLDRWYYHRNGPAWLDWKSVAARPPKLSWFPQALWDPPQIPGELLFFPLLAGALLGLGWLSIRAAKRYNWSVAPRSALLAGAMLLLIVAETWMHLSLRSPYTYICHFEQPAAANYWYQVYLFPAAKGAVNADYFVFRALEVVFLGTPEPLNGMLIRRSFPYYLSAQFSYFFNPYYVMIVLNVLMWLAASLAIMDYVGRHVGRGAGQVAGWLTASAPGFIMYAAQPQTYLWGYGAVAIVIWAHWRLCGSEQAGFGDYALLGGILALALQTYDLFAIVAYLIGYELLVSRRIFKILISISIAIGLYVAFGALTARMSTIVPDHSNSQYLATSLSRTVEVLTSNPLAAKTYNLYIGLVSSYIMNLSNTVFVFPLLIAAAGILFTATPKVLRLIGLLALPGFVNYIVLYFGQTELATFPRFVYIGYPAVYIACAVAVVRLAELRFARWAPAAVAAVAIGLHVALTNVDVFGYPWLYYLFYYQRMPLSHFTGGAG